jgi:multidrug resistance efflux pump
MSVAFSRTLRSLHVERSRGAAIAVLLIAIIVGVWTVWLMFGRVSIYAVSANARLEAGTFTHPIQSLYAGRIATNNLVLGRPVKKGDILIELDTNVQRLQLFEERTERGSLRTELENIQREIDADERAMEEEQKAAQLGIAEAQARLREAEAAATYLNMDAERKAKLHQAGLLSQLEYARVAADAQKQNALIESLRLAVKRQDSERLALQSQRRSRIEALKREAGRLAGTRTKLGAALHRLESEMELRRIVAPIDGKIGEVSNFRIGSVISAGEKLGAVVPAGTLKVVAQFEPANALGRVRHGQPARLRFDGFPWTQYGTLTATVTTVANEVRDGYVRVELSPSPGFRIPLQHGLPGATEVEIERISPAALLLRTAGQMLAPQRSKQTAASSAAQPAPEGQPK